MRNGGGPACLRLRIVHDAARNARGGAGLLPRRRAGRRRSKRWIKAHYREELAPADLADPALVDETQRALDELTRILPLGGDFYPFQRAGNRPGNRQIG